VLHLGALLGVAAIAIPATTAGAVTATAPTTGGMSFEDPSAPSVFAAGSTLAAPLGELVGDDVTFAGSLAGSHPGDAVAVQRLDAVAGWATVATATVAADGTFTATWQAQGAGRTSVRVVPAALASATTAAPAAATASATTATGDGRPLTVYRPARVTWYGPGFYGHLTACGLRLTPQLVGVAHRTLPCGTMVDLFNAGRRITVPVVDRGPFRKGTRYDLTAATARALGVRTTTTVGAVPVAPPPTAAPAS
jgi:hypothetical protein